MDVWHCTGSAPIEMMCMSVAIWAQASLNEFIPKSFHWFCGWATWCHRSFRDTCVLVAVPGQSIGSSQTWNPGSSQAPPEGPDPDITKPVLRAWLSWRAPSLGCRQSIPSSCECMQPGASRCAVGGSVSISLNMESAASAYLVFRLCWDLPGHIVFSGISTNKAFNSSGILYNFAGF